MRGPLPFFLLTLLLATSITSCAGGGLRGADLSESQADAVRAVVYRYQMAHDAQPETQVFCLCSPSSSHEYGDPSSALLVRFDDESRPVVTCSACQVEEGRIVERSTGKTAITLYIADVRPLPSGEVLVEGGSRLGKFFSTRMRYRVVREGENWKVADVLGMQAPVR
jgi:hypothetical protein